MTPYEIVGAPLTLWLAPVGTAFPLINAAPAAGWIKVGTNGDANYSEEGVTVTHSETIATATPAGRTGAAKAWRTGEQLMVGVTLWDITLEQYAAALNGAVVATTAAGAGTAGFKKMGLSQNQDVTLYALLARGVSPYGDGMAAQYQVPRCYQSGNPAPQYQKGVPTGLALEFMALEDPNAASAAERFGSLIAQHQAPL